MSRRTLILGALSFSVLIAGCSTFKESLSLTGAGPCPQCPDGPTVEEGHFAGSAPTSNAGTADHQASITVTEWLDSLERERMFPPNLRATDQEGKAVDLKSLAGRPFAVSFIYTRCTNPNKCRRVADSMARLLRV